MELVFSSACICIEHSYDCVKPFASYYIPHKWIVLFARADWPARRWLAKYNSPPFRWIIVFITIQSYPDMMHITSGRNVISIIHSTSAVAFRLISQFGERNNLPCFSWKHLIVFYCIVFQNFQQNYIGFLKSKPWVYYWNIFYNANFSLDILMISAIIHLAVL